jgi:peptide/nickel transport system substrate-binding protein
VALGGWLFALACSGTPQPDRTPSPVALSVGVPQSRQLDPTHGASILAGFLSSEHLTGNGPDGRVTPKLLERWSVSPDGLTWRLTLRPDVVFQDGTPLTPADVKRVLDATLAERDNRSIAVSLSDITDVAIEGTSDVVVRLRRRCSYLLDDFDFSITRPGPSGLAIGTGPFSILSSSPDEIVMQANERYYLGAPAISRIVLRPYDTLRTAWAEMLRGRVDFVSEIAPDAVEFVQDQSEVRVHSFLSSYVYALTFNSNRPVFRDPAVRRALSLALDREAILRQGLRGRGIPAYGPIWPRHWIALPSLPALQHDPEAATALLDKALGSAPAAARGRPLAPRVRFTCLMPLNFTLYERLALLVQQQLWDINVDMRLEAVTPDVFNGRIETGEFDAALMHLAGGPYISLIHRFWHSPDPSQRWNFWGYRNVEVDAALDQLRAAPDDEQVRAAVRRFDRAQRENPPALFLAWNETAQSISRRFDVPTETGRDAFSGLMRARPLGAAQARR